MFSMRADADISYKADVVLPTISFVLSQSAIKEPFLS